MFKTIWIIIQIIVGFNLWFPFVLLIIASIRKNFNKRQCTKLKVMPVDYAVIVTVYQQVELIEGVVQSILTNSYKNYIIYVVADDCDISGIHFNNDRVVILKPETPLRSNVKSHFYAIKNFKRPHNVITIIDSDNVVPEDYLSSLDKKFQFGYTAVQGVRKAKNTDNLYSCLDEAGDMFYRFIDRKLLFESGSSSSLAGSGMAFLTQEYINCLKDFDKSGAGFDKFLQYKLISQGAIIAFDEDVIVYDGKTNKSDQLVKQRARWINTWFRYWNLGLKLFIKSILTLNWNKFAFSVMLMRPPLFMLFLGTVLLLVLNIVFSPIILSLWAVILLLFFVIFFMALKYFKADKKIYQSLLKSPLFIFYQLKALFISKFANKISVATKHDTTY